jgi:CDP-diacylglycerol--glycerol-3-phosphate 3-phosphatidyltransferase
VEAYRAAFKQGWERFTSGFVDWLAARGVTPNEVSVAGLLISIASAPLLASGALTLGGWVLTVGSIGDSIDGALARRTGAFSEVGAFLDSTFDRIGEGVALAGVAIFLARGGNELAVGAIVLGLLGGSVTSYARARAESLGIECTVGWFARPERMLLVCALLIFRQPALMAYLLAIATCVTACQRIWHVRAALAESARSKST